MSTEFIRVPPDSTGKKIRHIQRLDIRLVNILIDFKTINRGVNVVGSTSGTIAKFIGFKVELNEYILHVTDANGAFQVGEVLSINSVNAATVQDISDMFTPALNLVDADTPFNKLKIDDNGSSFVTFKEGNPSIDAFGNLNVSNLYRMDDHCFVYGDRPDKYYTESVSGGAVSISSQDSALVLSTNSSSGSRITRTTHQDYPYTPGQGNEILMSIMVGDQGKQNVIRRWGLFDDENGLFWQISGTTIQVVIRNSSTGSVVDEVVNQDDFNGDPLDDNNSSHYLLDVSKYNIYWIDYQWLGSGRVRFGTYSPSGEKIQVHTFYNSNNKTVPFMNNGSQPFRIEQLNTSTTSSSSELKMVCATILRQSPDSIFSGKIYDAVAENKVISGNTNYVPLVTVKPPVTFNGKRNGITIMPLDFEIFVEGDSCKMDLIVGGTLTGATFDHNVNPFSCAIVDTAATSVTGGFRANTILLGSGMNSVVLKDSLDFAINMNADGTTQSTYTLAAKTNKPNGSAIIHIVSRWKEII